MNQASDITPAAFSELISALCRSRGNKPSVSDTFIDSSFLKGCSEQEATNTLLQIEGALSISGPAATERAQSLGAFIGPLLEQLIETGALDKLMELGRKGSSDGHSQNAENQNSEQRGTFVSLQPVVEALERVELPAEVFNLLPASASGAAAHALTSALRYGACLELVNQIIEGSAEIDPEGNSTAICEVPRLGKIRSWQFDPDTKSGSLFVDDMKVDRYTFRYDDAEGVVKSTLIEQWSYDWEIEIAENGYTLSKRDSQREYLNRLQSDPDADPFVDVEQPGNPNRPALPAEAKDFLNPDSIWGRGLTGRLFAQGKAIAIKSVTGKRYAMKTLSNAGATAVFDTVYTAIDGTEYLRDHVIEGNVVFSPTHALLKISEDSCIDIMFALSPNGNFPETIQDFPESQRGWCMGRCNSPLIANSR